MKIYINLVNRGYCLGILVFLMLCTIEDVIVAILLSFLSMGLKKYSKALIIQKKKKYFDNKI